MKKYFVIKVHKFSSPDIVFQTDIRKDATEYCDLMKRNNPDKNYIVGCLFAE